MEQIIQRLQVKPQKMCIRDRINTAIEPPRVITILFVKPAIRYPTKQQPATTNVYGICEDTCSIWLQPAPVEDKIVVSEIGEQWSPNTEPARVAARATLTSSGATELQIMVTIGIRIPKVPQEVPMAKASPPATRNTTAGISVPGIWDAATRLPT